MALTKKELDDLAYATIRGEYGNGDARKKNLGANYNEVQARVNELSKQNGGASNVKSPSTSSVKTTTTVSSPKASSTPTVSATVKTATKPVQNVAQKPVNNTANKPVKAVNDTKAKNTTSKNEKDVKKANTITVQKLDGTTKKVANNTVTIPSKKTETKTASEKKTTNKVNTEQARKNYEKKIGHEGSTSILTDEDTKAMKQAVDTMGTGEFLQKNLSKYEPTQNLQSKYGKTSKELLEMYEQDRRLKEKKFANEHPVLGTAKAMTGNILIKPLQSLSTVLTNAVAPNFAEQTERDYGNTLKHISDDTANLKSGVTKDMGNVGATAYNMGTGIAENVLPYVLGAPVGIANSALTTAGDTMLSARDRDVSRRASAGEAIVSGAVDATLNKFGLDKIKGLQATGNVGKDLIKQMAIGGGEQAITEIANSVADSIIAGDNSVADLTYKNYRAQGLNDNQALLNTIRDVGGNALANIGSGAVIGGAIGSGRKILSDVVNPRIPSIFTPENRVDAVADNIETPNYRWGRTADRLIPQDSYARTPEYMDLDNQYKTNFEQIEQLKQRRTELNNALATESAPKPREEWNTQDEIQALLGDTPMNYTENGNRILDELDGIKQNISDLESKNSLINEERDLIKGNTRVNRLENYTPKEFVPATRENYQGFSTTKGVHNDLVQSGKAHLVEMSPEEYIRRCADEIFKDDVATLESVISSRDQKNIDKYAQMMKEGTEFDTPYLDYDSSNQEGLHRALAAYEAGLDVMPVVVKGSPETGDLDYSARNRISEINNSRFERENPIEDMDIDDEILFDDIPNPYGWPRIENPSALPRQEAEPIRNIPSPQSDFIVPDMDADLAQSSERGISRTYDNYLERNGLTSSVEELRNAERQYDVRHNPEVVNDATSSLKTQEDADYWKKGYITGRNKINSDTDVVRATLLLQDVVNKSKETRNIGQRTQLEAEATMLRRKIRKAGTDISHGLHAFDILKGTSEGAIINTQRIFDKNVEDWSGKNTNKSKAIDNVAKQLTSSKVDKALADMGNDSLKAKNITPKKPMSHEELIARVKGSFGKELSSVESQFKDSDYEFVASMVEANVPTYVITDEIQHKLNHGEWYTIDESTPVKVQESSKLNSILKNMGNDMRKAKNQQEPTPKSHATVVEEVRNSLLNEMGSSDITKESDFDFIATMLEENVPNSVIEDEIQHRLLHGEWYTIDEAIEPKKAENSVLKRAVDMLVEPEEVAVEKPAPTFDEIREQVQTTLDNNSQIFYNNKRQFTDADVDYLSNLIANGASSNDISDSIKNRLVNGVWDVPEQTINKVNQLWEEARHLPMNSKDRVDLETQAYWELANCNGENSSLADKFESWRFLAMLGNPKTHVRNIIGNALFSGVNKISDAVASGIEYGVDSLTKNGIERTKAILTPQDKDLLNASKRDAVENAYRQLSGNKYLDNAKASIKMQKEVFSSPFMRKLNAINSNALDKEDTLAMQNTYKRVLASFLKANGADASIFDAEPRLKNLEAESRVRLLSDADIAEMNNLKSQIDLLEKGREYAIGKAEYAAFHEDNAFADWLKNASKNAKTKGGKILIEGLVPFKTTPANILRSGLEYSPLNIVNDAYKAVQLKKGNVNASELIDSLSKTLTGSGLMMLGVALQRKGVLNSSDEETKWQDELEGIQNYSLTVGGKTFTIDFAVPSAMPLLLGAEIAKAIDRSGNTSLDEEEDIYGKIEGVIQAVSRMTSPIMETSMLSGVNDTLESLAYNGVGDAIPSLLGTLATGYVSQGVPTILGQLSRTVDNTRRSTYSDKTGLGKTVDKALTKTMNKLPLSRFNEPYVDAYGRGQSNAPSDNILARGLYQFLSPAYMQDVNTTDVDAERRRLYNTKDEAGNPITNEKVFSDLDTQGKVAQRKLSKEEYTVYTKKKGEIDYNLSLEMLKNDRYKALEDTEKADLMKKSEDIAKKLSASDFGGTLTKKEQKYLDIYNESGAKGLADALLPSDYDNFVEANNLENAKPLEKVGAYINSLNASPEEKAKAFIDIYKDGDVSQLKKGAKEFYENGEYIQFLNSYLAPEKSKEKSATSKKATSNAIPSPSSLPTDTQSPADLSKYINNRTSKNGVQSSSLDRSALAVLQQNYQTNAERSRAILDSGVSTKGVNKARQVWGDDYVYDYYQYKYDADTDNDGLEKRELTAYLKNLGFNDNDIAKWWSVYK